MKNLIATAAFASLLMAGSAYAAQTTLSDQQMDTITAGVGTVNVGHASYDEIDMVGPWLGPVPVSSLSGLYYYMCKAAYPASGC